MKGREYRRDGVPEYVVDGSSWPPKAVNGDDAWALFCASADGDLDQARRLIEGDPNLVHAQIWYAKPIDVAMREGHLEIMKLMLDADEQRWLFDHTREWCYRTTESELQRRGFEELVEYRNSWKTSLAPNYRPEFERLRELLKGDKATSWKEEELSNAKVLAAVDADRTLLQATGRRGLTLLHVAIEAQNLVIVTALLGKGSSARCENRSQLDSDGLRSGLSAGGNSTSTSPRRRANATGNDCSRADHRSSHPVGSRCVGH